MERCNLKPIAGLTGLALTAVALAGCTEKGEISNNDEAITSANDTFCEIAAGEQAQELLQIDPAQISNESCLSDEPAGVIGQYIISLELDGPVADSAEMTVTLIDEQSAQNSEMVSFSELIANIPADDLQQVEIAGEQHDAVYASNGVAVALGDETLMVSVEQSALADPATGIITPTLDPSIPTELTTGNAPAAYAGYVAENLESDN